MKKLFFLLLALALTAGLFAAAAAESILPALATPAPQSLYFPNIEKISGVRLQERTSGVTEEPFAGSADKYRYINISHDLYQRYGAMLGGAGYTLSDSAVSENGKEITAVVTNGDVTLKLYYQLGNSYLYVTSAAGVGPEPLDLLVDSVILHDGDVLDAGGGLTLTVRGTFTVTDAEMVKAIATSDPSSVTVLALKADYRGAGESPNLAGLLWNRSAYGSRMQKDYFRTGVAPAAWQFGDTLTEIDFPESVSLSALGSRWVLLTANRREGGTPDDPQVITFTLNDYSTRYLYYLEGEPKAE